MNRASARLPFVLGAVILAAGRSARMGRAKLLLPWGQSSVLGHLLRQWQALQAERLAVVFAAGDQPILAELDRLGFPPANRISNPAPERGMFGSIQCAACWPVWPATVTHYAIALGDQPHLRYETLKRLLEFAVERPGQIVQPGRHGHGRHPVLMPKSQFLDLAVSPVATLKEFLAAAADQVALYEVDDPGFDLDVDHPEDYKKALALRQPHFSL